MQPYSTPAEVANYFIWKAHQEEKTLTAMKLIKLVYIAYAWVLTTYDRRLFGEDIQAWEKGPVIPSLWNEFKTCASNIDRYAIAFHSDVSKDDYSGEYYPLISDDDKDVVRVLAGVWDHYKDKSGTELSDITHQDGSAWQAAWNGGEGRNCQINDDKELIAKIKERASKAISEYLSSVKETKH